MPTSYDSTYFNRNIPETWYRKAGLLRPDQLAGLAYVMDWPFWTNHRTDRRDPGHVLSVGCGLGDLEKKLEELHVKVTGYDPHYYDQYQGRECLQHYKGEQYNTILFCESIEHLPEAEIFNIINHQKGGTRIIIVNWPDNHPILPEGFDHITQIDNEFFYRLLDGRKPLIMKGSHLVYDK